MKIKFCHYCIMLSVLASHAADFDLGTHGTLSMAVPEDWTASGKAANRPDGTPTYAITLTPRSDANVKCMLTFAYLTPVVPNKERIRNDVLRITKQFVSESVEKKQNLNDFSLEEGYGAYCVFTDASLVGKKGKPGDYKVMGGGEVQPSEGVIGVVSLFADDADSKEFKTMVKIINSLKAKPKAAK